MIKENFVICFCFANQVLNHLFNGSLRVDGVFCSSLLGLCALSHIALLGGLERTHGVSSLQGLCRLHSTDLQLHRLCQIRFFFESLGGQMACLHSLAYFCSCISVAHVLLLRFEEGLFAQLDLCKDFLAHVVEQGFLLQINLTDDGFVGLLLCFVLKQIAPLGHKLCPFVAEFLSHMKRNQSD